jgi:hypothetical protein
MQTSAWSLVTREFVEPFFSIGGKANERTYISVCSLRLESGLARYQLGKCHQQVRRLQARIVKATQEGRWGKVKALQWLLTHSFSGKAIAVKRVTENKGKKTSGVDGETWSTPKAKSQADVIAQKARLPTAASETGLYSKKQRQGKTVGYTDDE